MSICGRTTCDPGQAATGHFSKHSLGILASVQFLSETFLESDFYADYESCFKNCKKYHFKLIKLLFQKFCPTTYMVPKIQFYSV